MKPKTSMAAERGLPAHKDITDRLMTQIIRRGAIMERESGSVMQNKTLNDDEE